MIEMEKLLFMGAALLGVLYIFGKAPKIGAKKPKTCKRPFAKGAVWQRGPITADYAEDSLAFPAAPIM